MRRNELDYILGTMLDFRANVSDLIFTVDKPPQVEADGVLVPVPFTPALERLTPFQTETIALNLCGGNPRLVDDLLRTGSCDTSYSVIDKARFRVNIFSQRGNYSIVLRKLNTKIATLADLQLPEILHQPAKEKTGLVLVTGATGSGKSTTLAAMLDEINGTRSVHIVTLEDPVEFVYSQKMATINQREMGADFDNFSSGLRAALRQAPKIILVGEMRDRATVEIALSAAETGHLVMSTLHTIDAGQTINRILGMFETDEQEQVRHRLADTLRWIVGQRLAPKVGGGRHALLEIMGYPFGWRSFDQSCLDSYEQNLISEDTAMLYCTKRGQVQRGIDNIKKKRGENTTEFTLKMAEKLETRTKSSGPPPLQTIKMH
jgi:twitching motility protein PilT